MYKRSGSQVPDDVVQYECGSYEQLGYWANNFDDMAASLVNFNCTFHD